MIQKKLQWATGISNRKIKTCYNYNNIARAAYLE